MTTAKFFAAAILAGSLAFGCGSADSPAMAGDIENDIRRTAGDDMEEVRGNRDGMRDALATLATEVDITDDMRRQLREAGRATQEAVRDSRKALHEGDGTAEDVRDAVREARIAMETSAGKVLGSDAATRLDELLAAQQIAHATQGIERLTTRSDKRVEFLTTQLKLNDEQSASLRAISVASAAAATDFLAEVAAGEHEREDIVYQRITTRAAADAELRTILTASQIETLDELEAKRGRENHADRGPRGEGPRGEGPRDGRGGPRGRGL